MDAAFALPEDTTFNASPALPKAVDLSHHLNLLARSRKANTLKGLYQYAGRPGMVALAGGMPPPEFFPFETLEAEIMTFDSKPKTAPLAALASAKESKVASPSLFSWLFNKPTTKPKPTTQHISVPKYNTGVPGTVDLASLLQYSSAQGNPALLAFIKDFSARAYTPAYADWEVLLNIGATQAWNLVVNLLCERGDPILVEEFTYPGAMNAYVPLGCPKVPIEMDGEGIIPASLEKILSEWDVTARGMKRPSVFYTVPTGQNPTGATMLGKRKKEVYEIFVKYDVICVEDDPYFWLGGAPWVPQAGKKSAETAEVAQAQNGMSEVDRFLGSVAPSYLKFDYQGRVIRLDTFSKTIAPGSRLGWFTCNPLFAERLLRATESSAQAPSGYGQAMVTTLLNTWRFDGYVRWMQGIQATYSMRRDWMCDAFEQTFHLEFEQRLMIGGSKFIGVEAYAKTSPGRGASVMDEKRGFKSKKALLSFVPPSAGMFLWIKIQPENFAAYHSLCAAGDPVPEETFMESLWKELADNNVLVSPGTFFDGRTDVPESPTKHVDTAGYFRLSFSIATHEQQKAAIQTFHDVLAKWAK